MYRGDYIEIIDTIPYYSFPNKANNYPIIGDKGHVAKRMHGGWLKVRFERTGELTTIRNGSYLQLVSSRKFHNNDDSSQESLVLEDNNMISISDQDDDYIEEHADDEEDDDCEVNNYQIKMLQEEIAQLRVRSLRLRALPC